MSKSILCEYTPTELQFLLDTSNGYSDVLRKIGLNPKGGNPETLKKIIEEFNLSVDQMEKNRSDLFKHNASITHKKIAFDLQEILEGKHPNYQSSKSLKRLVDSGIKENKCECCGICKWMNKPITLQLHHKDGNHSNNSLDNLQILCPNCHTQTDTYGGKSSKKNATGNGKRKFTKTKEKELSVPPISRMELKNRIRIESFVSISKEYGVSDNAIRKWCIKYHLPSKKSVINKISNEEWDTI